MAFPQLLHSPQSSIISREPHLNPTNYPKPSYNFLALPFHLCQWWRKSNPLTSSSSFSEKHRLVRKKPYLVVEVTWLKDRPSTTAAEDGDDLNALASEVEMYMKDVIRLSNRLNSKPEEVGDLRRNPFPTPFSFFVGSTFERALREQQALLEVEDTTMRLKRELETLRNTLNYLTAISAVKDVFPLS